jgi:hypothetical protein
MTLEILLFPIFFFLGDFILPFLAYFLVIAIIAGFVYNIIN